MKRKSAAILMAGLMAISMVLTAGCGAGDEPITATDGEPITAADGEPITAADDEPITAADDEPITIVYVDGNGLQNWDLTGIIDPSEVNLVGVAENEITNKAILEMTQGNKGYDIIISSGPMTVELASYDLLEPLEALEDQDDIFASSINNFTYLGTQYGYPMQGDSMIMYINMNMWEDAGYTDEDIPKTLDEYREKAIHLTKDANGVRGDEEGFDSENIEQYGTMFFGKAGDIANTVFFQQYGKANGANFVELDYENNIINVTCDSPEMISTVEWVKDMAFVDHACPEGFVGYSYDEINAQWESGNIGMVICWPYLFSLTDGTAMEGHVRAVGSPAGNAGVGVTSLGGWAMNVFKDAPHKEKAMEIAKILAGAEANYTYNEAIGSNSCRFSVVERKNEEAAAAGNDAQIELNKAYVESANAAVPGNSLGSTGPCGTDAQNVTATYLNMIFSGQVSAEDGLKELKTELETIFADNDFMQGN